LPERVTELESALEAGQIENLSRFAHNLKGLSMSFNAGALSSLAAKLEVLGKEKKLAAASMLVEQIANEVIRVQQYISKQLD
jgi:HPt (histidine-containing phosphotransfer) domain-containing protein